MNHWLLQKEFPLDMMVEVIDEAVKKVIEFAGFGTHIGKVIGHDRHCRDVIVLFCPGGFPDDYARTLSIPIDKLKKLGMVHDYW